MPMQPSPRADTSRLLFPSMRFRMLVLLRVAVSILIKPPSRCMKLHNLVTKTW